MKQNIGLYLIKNSLTSHGMLEISFVIFITDRSKSMLLLWFISSLAGNEDMHKISDDFEFRPDQTTDYGVSCP